MKRRLTAVFTAALLLAALLLPPAVHADYGLELVGEYTMRVVNEGGLLLTEYGGKNPVFFPYGARLKITYWKGGDGSKVYEYAPGSRYYQVEPKQVERVVKDPDKATLKKEDLTLVVCGSGVSLYKGPGESYGAAEKNLPENTELRVQYHDGMWALTEYNGTEGWVYFRRTSTGGEIPPVAIRPENASPYNMTCLRDVVLSRAPGDLTPSGKEIRANTDVTCDLQYSDLLGAGWYHLTDGNSAGWYYYPGDLSVVYRTFDAAMILGSEALLRQDPSDASLGTVAVPAGSILQVLGYGFDAKGKAVYCVEHEGSALWVPDNAKYELTGMKEVETSLPEPDVIEPRPEGKSSGNGKALTFGLIGGGAVALTAGLTLLLLSGRKRKDEQQHGAY